jgi:hypothetical protein
MSGQVLALVVETRREYPGGEFVDFDVCDSRTGEALASRATLESANEVAVLLNSTYPIHGLGLSSDFFVPPAHDTLVHEIIGNRISGEPPICIETWWMLNPNLRGCPGCVPVGPGWDHLIEAARLAS